MGRTDSDSSIGPKRRSGDEQNFFEKHFTTFLSMLATLTLAAGTGLIAYGRGQEKASHLIQQCETQAKDVDALKLSAQNFVRTDDKVNNNAIEINTLKGRQQTDHDAILEMKGELKLVADWVRQQQRRSTNNNQP